MHKRPITNDLFINLRRRKKVEKKEKDDFKGQEIPKAIFCSPELPQNKLKRLNIKVGLFF